MTLSPEPLPRAGSVAKLDSLHQADVLLRDFFRREMPAPWPAWQPPVETAVAKPKKRKVLGRSYVALAASVLALIGVLSLTGEMMRVAPAPKPEMAVQPLPPGDGKAEKPSNNGRRIRPGPATNSSRPGTSHKELNSPKWDLPRNR
jgi:hypothetical protein